MSSTTMSKVQDNERRKPIDGQTNDPNEAQTVPHLVFPVTAKAGDHPAIHRFLTSIFHGPSSAEFHAQQEEPFCEPTDRILIRSQDRILSHVRMTRREMHFGDAVLPIAGVHDLATQPEFRRQGLASRLVEEVEHRMMHDGGIVSFVRTIEPRLFSKRGWAVCGRHGYGEASARDILSCLSARRAGVPDRPATTFDQPKPQPINIRLWRHVEQAALMRLYKAQVAGQFGPIVRTDSYWRWLISRRGYDRIYIAIEGPDKFELDDTLDPIIGYAVVKDSCIVELVAAPERQDAISPLLERACGDSIERDYHRVRIMAPPNHSLYELAEQAGGKYHYHEAEQGELFMAKVLDWPTLFQHVGKQLQRRAKAARLDLPTELGFQIGDERYRFAMTKRSHRLLDGKAGRSYLICGRKELTQIVLGHISAAEAIASGKVEVSTRVAADIASALFPALPLWRPPLDELTAE